ncbi:glucosamine inositolphosphorylceramide transferase family protein [Halarchaeum nitratireducens]|uniref:Glucosamine inositolphosphorylceramide transferase 1 N-terminal domain-containing protein n=1 Tax=Halarchaeum nitratireducens TaxID=489913 RepID=A0A830GB28_9EURY|nr:hypothetical protein [Halarchaeum nitratireducens]GGN16654.1 hypothetical protein GCM10009021_16670 [Halarchaeum nitratireducens]
MSDDRGGRRDADAAPAPHPRGRNLAGDALRALRTRLGASPAVGNAAWRLGELLHHGGGERRPGTAEAGRIAGLSDGPDAPTYPIEAPIADPLDPAPAPGVVNPVLTVADVTDVTGAHCVADPFLLPLAGTWHLFFEVYAHYRRPTAVIAHATSPDGADWTYDGVVLETEHHLSYPYAFRWDGDHYMVPDAWSKDPANPAPVTLYRARDFPRGWEPIADLFTPPGDLHDCTLFRWDGRWWALCGDGRDLYAYHSDALDADGWTPHAANPVVAGRPAGARPGGRPIVRDERVLAFYQDGTDHYGGQVRAYEITDLTPETYRDREADGSPVMHADGERFGWLSGFTHQFDPWYDGEGWWCAVDGNPGFGWRLTGDHHWAIGMFRA